MDIWHPQNWVAALCCDIGMADSASYGYELYLMLILTVFLVHRGIDTDLTLLLAVIAMTLTLNHNPKTSPSAATEAWTHLKSFQCGSVTGPGWMLSLGLWSGLGLVSGFELELRVSIRVDRVPRRKQQMSSGMCKITPCSMLISYCSAHEKHGLVSECTITEDETLDVRPN